MSKKVTRKEVDAAMGMLDDGGPLPSDHETPAATEMPDPANGKSMDIRFEHLPDGIDPFRLAFFPMQEDGATIVCQFVRRWAKGEKDGLEHAAIEVVEYPTGTPYLLPGNVQLWETFGNLIEAGEDFDKAIYRIQRVSTVKKPDGTTKFVRFTVQRGFLPA